MSTVAKYKKYYDSLKGKDVKSQSLLEQNKTKEDLILQQYKNAAKTASNAYNDSSKQLDQQKARAIQEANAFEQRLARYIPELNQRSGISGTGMAESTALEAYSAQEGQKRNAISKYETEQNNLLKEYARTASAMENEKLSKIADIDAQNLAILSQAKDNLTNAYKSNLQILGEGVKNETISVKDYIDYYNSVVDELDPELDANLMMQYNDIAGVPKGMLLKFKTDKKITRDFDGETYEYKDGRWIPVVEEPNTEKTNLQNKIKGSFFKSNLIK
ncbi:MAG: hypothetical protein IJW19_00020 [Clostridia bacterium]|nr:hypothetical protein [Clostridia bacterium]